MTVNVTVFDPRLAQVKLFGDTLRLAIPQPDVLPPSTSAAEIDALPSPLRKTVAFLQTATGPAVMLTLAVLEAVQLAPFVTVRLSVT